MSLLCRVYPLPIFATSTQKPHLHSLLLSITLMARQLSQTLIKFSSSPLSLSSRLTLSRRTIFTKAELIEVDLDSSGDVPGTGEVMGLNKLEDAIHSIIVRRLAPDWLPFRPGSSYWVPPKRPAGSILDVVGKLTNPLTEEETLSLTSSRGWPSSSFFLEGSVSEHSIPVEVEVHVRGSPEKTSSSEDE